MAGAGMPAEWAEVEEASARVDQVDPARIQEVARQFDEASRDASDHTAALTSAAAPLRDGGVWDGPAADAFFDYVATVAAAGSTVTDRLDEAADGLTTLQVTLSHLKHDVHGTELDAKAEMDGRNAEAQRRADAAEAAMRAHQNGQRNLPPSPTADEIIRAAGEANSKTAREAADRIHDLLRQANEAIKKAQGLMRTELEGGFSSVPPPGAAPSTPPGTGGIGGDGGGSGGGGSPGGRLAGYGPSGPPPASGPPPGNVEQWIREAIRILQSNGIQVTEDNIDEIWTIIEKESGGNPHALNDWDSNAARGTPSKGLMQCIDPTFQAYKLPGHGDIWNPVDNIIAGIRYTFDRYGGFEGHPGLASMAAGGGYQGY
jgi:uncharacterized protein YukE